MLMVFFFLRIPRADGNPAATQSFLSKMRQLDLLGACAFFPAVIMLLLAVEWGGTTYAWQSSQIIGLFVGAGVATLLFVFIEIRQQNKALLPPQFFTRRDVLCAMLYALFVGMFFFPIVYYIGEIFPRPSVLEPSILMCQCSNLFPSSAR
jgi:hypothetical protein